MGIFDKLKSVTAALTGSGAKVMVEANNPGLGNPFPVRITAVIGEKDIKANRIYVKVEGQEKIVARGVAVAREYGGQIQRGYEDVTRFETTFQQEFIAAGAQVLQANQTYTWDAEVQLPGGLPPTYYGRNATHEWKIQAGIDTSGNDPDSGWVVIEMR